MVMTREMVPANFATLETMIDAVGLSAVLDHIAEVCYTKAEHCGAKTIKDVNLSYAWDKVGKQLANNDIVCPT